MLTDKRIDEYILRGHYGEDAKAALEKQRKKKPKFNFDDALRLLLGDEKA